MSKKALVMLLCALLLVSVLSPAAAALSGDTYDPDAVYTAGSTVVYNGVTYTAKWYTQGTAPGQSGSAWERAAEYDANGVAIWYDGMVCTGGTKVSHNGSVYEAKWWTDTEPGSDSSWTLVSGSGSGSVTPTATPAPTAAPTAEPTPVPTGTPSGGASEWNASATYLSGAHVTYNGVAYTAKYYNSGANPATSGAWERVPEYDANGVAVWYTGMVCTGGTKVSHNGSVYEAKWWTNTEPGSDSSWTLVSGSGSGSVTPTPAPTETPTPTAEPTPVPTGTPSGDVAQWSSSKVYVKGDQALYDGVVYTAKYYNSGETPSTSSAWEREPEYVDGVIVWYDGLVCTAGDRVYHNGEVFEAKYWTDTEPGTSTSWRNITNPSEDEGDDDTPATVTVYSDYTVDASLVSSGSTGFNVVGYFPFYSSSWADNIDWDSLTHIIYAFAFPDGQGGLQALDDVALVQKLIEEGHAHGVKVLLGVGGWAYYGTIMEYQFDGCTATPELTNTFTDAILALVDQYGFDGVDVDWEHPRAGSDSWERYEAMMIQLREKLGSGRLLTSAVLSGVTTDGTVYYDAAAHTANVMAVCDWFNVMAYDCECTLDFCKSVANYWCGTRGMPANKICMGVPFYTYPGWSAYSTLVASDPTAATDDMAGTSNFHNSVTTMQAKTSWAMEYGLGGMMIWELSQDSTDPSVSLLKAISSIVEANS